MSDKIPTIDFGAPNVFGAHVFHVEIAAGKNEPVRIVEDYGYQGGENGLPYEEPRAVVSRSTWTIISATARSDFNDRLKAQKQTTGRWKIGKTLVDRLLGKELCVLAWASEKATAEQLPIICARWSALRPEERWWLFSMTVAEAGLPEDGDRGWRRALYFALSDGDQITNRRRRRARPKAEQQDIQSFFTE